MARWPIRLRKASDRQALLDARGHYLFLIRLVRLALLPARAQVTGPKHYPWLTACDRLSGWDLARMWHAV